VPVLDRAAVLTSSQMMMGRLPQPLRDDADSIGRERLTQTPHLNAVLLTPLT